MSVVRWEWGLAIALSLLLPAMSLVRRERLAARSGAAFLALGDSYTIGEKVDAADRWPVQLAGMLRARRLQVADPVIVARTGWTTDELDSGITAVAPVGPFALVTLSIGVNNQFRGGDLQRYGSEFGSLLARAVAFAGGKPERVLVLSIPDWGVTPFAAGRDRRKIAAEIDRFNAVNREASRRAGASYVDVTTTSREEHQRWLTTDGLHPSPAQYRRWAELALDGATAALRSAR